MQIATVVGTVVATKKHPALQGAKLLLVQPETPEGEPRGPVLLSIDSVGAGIGERVLVVIEGKAAGDALGRRGAPVDAAIVGIIDRVDDTVSAALSAVPVEAA
jgi:ethanolamine utilization protein EutN